MCGARLAMVFNSRTVGLERGQRDRELAPGWDHPLARLVPYVFAAVTGFQILKYFVVSPAGIGFDTRLYLEASRAWLAGGDPWSVSSLGIFYGAPPPTLLAFAPLTALPTELVVWLVVAGSFVLAAMAFRSLGMPMWWLAAWPIVDGSLVGNPDVALLAVLTINRGRLAWIAPFLKIYGVLPLIADRRVRMLAVVFVALTSSALILPWSMWLAELPTISVRLAQVSDTTSVFGMPLLMAIAAIALLSLGLRRAGWLAVPVLWPSTQPHYLAMSLPALSPWLAIAWSFPQPYFVAGSVLIEAVVGIRRRFVDHQRAGEPA